jgi:cytochrome c-type biogenesis protein CcmF
MLKAGGLFAPLSREGGLVLNNLLLCGACAAVLTGTLYPLALETLTGEKISVGPPYFNLTFGIIVLPLLLLVPLGPFLTWKRADAFAAMQRLWFAAAAVIAVMAVVFALKSPGPWLAPFGIGLGLWLILGSLCELADRIQLGRVARSVSWARFKGLPRSSIGMTLAHAGVGIIILGIVATSAWREERILVMKPDDVTSLAGYDIRYLGESPLTGPNYTGEAGRFRIMSGNTEVATLVSEKRFFEPGRVPTTEVGLLHTLGGNIYIALGDKAGDGRAVRAYFHPLVSFIWIGAAIMFAGGLISLTDRRYRIGIPRKARAAALQPAE